MNKFFKIVATLEGISLLLLLFVAMPLKYIFDLPEFVRVIGMAHGLLFIGYIILATMLKMEESWNNKKFFEVCIASIISFGTFYMEKKYLKNS
ncbi:membrane protein [Flavobacterium lutivivi]|nr:membrane protein [Flavobacterium lutivivi]